MITAVMQPYLLPYIGYFQLMHAVDTWIFLDDVQYIDRGWVNRNIIPRNGKPSWLTLPVRKGSHLLTIGQREYLAGEESLSIFRNTIHAAYASAPFFDEVFPLIDSLLSGQERNVAVVNCRLIAGIASALGIGCTQLRSSSLAIDAGLRGEDRIIALCRRVGAHHYINPIGGVALYDDASFTRANLRLSFLRTTMPPLVLADGPQQVSIIDTMMREGLAACRERLPAFELLSRDLARDASAVRPS